jgi:choline dehydrogenase-like flavoprotein
MLMASPYDAIIIGTGAGGGTLALQLARAGKNILVLERGGFMPQEKLNWSTSAVFLREPLPHAGDVAGQGWQAAASAAILLRGWADEGIWRGDVSHALPRISARFSTREVLSPAWPISYAEMEPFYTQAEELFHVHGDLGSAPPVPGGYGSSFDPTEPFHSRPYPFAAFSNEPRMQMMEDAVRKLGVNTFPIPLGLKRNEADPIASKCVRCDTCDGYPCLVHAKSDADINCIREVMSLPNVTLLTSTRVLRLLTNAAGTAVTEVEVLHADSGATATYSADIFALCAGAINSAVVLLQSANDKHPRGLANNSSDQVGRNFMYHQADALLAITTDTNTDSYTKTWGTNDFYLKDPDPSYPYPLGQVQPVGSFHSEMMKGDAPPLTPGFVLETMKHRAVPWWLTTEDLPDPENRVTLVNTTPNEAIASEISRQPGVAGVHGSGDTGLYNESAKVAVAPQGRIQLSYTPNNVESFNRLKDRWVATLKQAGHADMHLPLSAYFKKRIPLEGVGHQNGTCRMGSDPTSSVLDVHCKAHDLDNLYVVDASCFPSASAVNPSLTIIANALRVGDHLLAERLK